MNRNSKLMFVIIVSMLAVLLSACGPSDCKPGMAVSPSTKQACPAMDSATGKTVAPTTTPNKTIEDIKEVTGQFKTGIDNAKGTSAYGLGVGDTDLLQHGKHINPLDSGCVKGVLSPGCNGK